MKFIGLFSIKDGNKISDALMKKIENELHQNNDAAKKKAKIEKIAAREKTVSAANSKNNVLNPDNI